MYSYKDHHPFSYTAHNFPFHPHTPSQHPLDHCLHVQQQQIFCSRQTQDKLVEIERGSAAGVGHSEKNESSGIEDEHRDTDSLGQNISKETAVDNQEVSLTIESESLTDARDESKSMPCARDDPFIPASDCDIGIIS